MARDSLTPDMFEVPAAVEAATASMDYRTQLSHMIAKMLKEAPGDRYAVAAELSRLTGKDVSKAMLDAYCSESREAWNLPAWLMPALEVACGTHEMTNWLVTIRGGRLLLGKETLNAQLGRLIRAKEEADSQIKQLKKLMGSMDE